MCYHFFFLSRDMQTYDVVKLIGESIGYTMVDIMDTMTIDPRSNEQWENLSNEDDNYDDLDFEFDDVVSIEYNLEIDEVETDDESIIDLTCEE